MENIQEIFTDKINDPQDSMRSELDREALWDLADDIKKNGLINPITVRPKWSHELGECPSPEMEGVLSTNCSHLRYEVVAGHRRLSACKIAGMIKIACVVRDVDDSVAFGIMASENLVREDVDPVDEADFINKIIVKTGQTIDEVATTIRRSRQYVEDRLTVAVMPDYLRAYLKNKQIKLGAALKLNQITDEAQRRMWVDLAVRDGISVRVADYWLTQWKMSQLPNALPVENPLSELPAGEYKPILFECALDGKKYPVTDTQMITIFKGNLQFVVALRAELSASPSE